MDVITSRLLKLALPIKEDWISASTFYAWIWSTPEIIIATRISQEYGLPSWSIRVDESSPQPQTLYTW